MIHSPRYSIPGSTGTSQIRKSEISLRLPTANFGVKLGKRLAQQGDMSRIPRVIFSSSNGRRSLRALGREALKSRRDGWQIICPCRLVCTHGLMLLRNLHSLTPPGLGRIPCFFASCEEIVCHTNHTLHTYLHSPRTSHLAPRTSQHVEIVADVSARSGKILGSGL